MTCRPQLQQPLSFEQTIKNKGNNNIANLSIMKKHFIWGIEER